MELVEQEHKHQNQCYYRGYGERFRCLGFAFKLAAVNHIVVFGQLYIFLDGALYVGNGSAQVAAVYIS